MIPVSANMPGREAVIGALVSAKLHLRRLLRHWRARARTRPRSAGRAGLLETGRDDADVREKDEDMAYAKNRGARLPARAPDDARAPIGVFVVALFVLAFAVRAYRIREPPSVVFDELHFGKFFKSYWSGSYYFDIHPPLGKLNMYAVSRMFSSHAPQSNFTHIGEKFDPVGDSVFFPIRLTSALFGSAVPPVTFLICRELGMSMTASFAPAVAQALDSLVIVESRLILMDAQLACFMALCLLCALRLWGAKKRTQRRLGYLLATSTFGALALSIKWTALATPGLVAVVSLLGHPFPQQGSLEIVEMGVAGVLAVFIYAAIFYVHFALLPNSGTGNSFMTEEFKKTLVGSPTYDPNAPKMSFLRKFSYLNVRMLTASANIKTRHHWESKWYQWIISRRGVLYHLQSYGKEGMARVYLIANIVVVYAVLFAIVGFVLYLALFYLPKLRSTRFNLLDKHHAFVGRGTFFFAGYMLNLLPYILVERCTFLYHYVPALFYGELALANSINALPSSLQRPVSFVFMGLTAAAFYYWSPWIYATPLTVAQTEAMQIYGPYWA